MSQNRCQTKKKIYLYKNVKKLKRKDIEQKVKNKRNKIPGKKNLMNITKSFMMRIEIKINEDRMMRIKIIRMN